MGVLGFASGLVVDALPNARGQPTQAAGSAATFATGVTYHPNGGMSGFTYGACSAPAVCVTHTMTQNARKLPLHSLDRKGTDTPVLDNTYTYDANGNVASITDGGDNPGRTRDQLTYDGLDRLTHTRAPSLAWFNADTVYDPLDNIRSNTVGSRTWTYLYNNDPVNGKNRLVQLVKPGGTSTLTYDVNGNMTGHGADTFYFDAANRLLQATSKESYAYDGHGRRVWMMRLSDSKASFPMYSLDGKLITEDDNRSNLTTDFVYLNGSLVAKRFKAIDGSTWARRYLYTDALGSPVGETDGAGTVTRLEHFTPYGEQTDTLAGGAIEQGPAFTGHVTDTATGLSYMQQRYYDPAIGRFLSVDPVMTDVRDGSNFGRYKYAKDNPYRYTDPDGRLDRERKVHVREVSRLKVVESFRASYRHEMRGVAARTSDPVKIDAVKAARRTGLASIGQVEKIVNEALRKAGPIETVTGHAGNGVSDTDRYVPVKRGLVDLYHVVSALALPRGNELGDIREGQADSYSSGMQEDYMAHGVAGDVNAMGGSNPGAAATQVLQTMGPLSEAEAQEGMRE